MRTLYMFFCVFIFSLPLSCYISGGVDYMFGGKWKFDFIGFNDYLDTRNNNNSFGKLYGGFINEKLGLSLGFKVDSDDNVVGKVNRFMGYAGYKNMIMRYQYGKIKGNFHWSGDLAPGMVRDGDLRNLLRHIDLLWRRKTILGDWLGFGYTSLDMPSELSVWYDNNVKGRSVYDLNYKGNFYSFIFGFDSFSKSVENLEKGKSGMTIDDKSGFSLYLTGEDRIGFGKAEISDEAIRYALFLNPAATGVKSKDFFAALIENDTGVGIRWISKNGSFAAGLGYEVSFIMILPFSPNPSAGEIDLHGLPSTIRYGPVIRVYGRF